MLRLICLSRHIENFEIKLKSLTFYNRSDTIAKNGGFGVIDEQQQASYGQSRLIKYLFYMPQKGW
jgi:hypothetical protein